MEEFYEKFCLSTHTIYKTDYWTLSLRPMQPTLGSCVISLNRYCERLSDITEAESTDFKNIVQYTEHNLTNNFKYDKINYLMLMMVDSQLHYHVIPRYEKKKELLNKNWIDEKWPTPPDLGGYKLNEGEVKSLITLFSK